MVKQSKVGTKRALLIGINYIHARKDYRLNGCVNDIINVENMLIDAFDFQMENIVQIRDDINLNNQVAMNYYPSSDNILRELENIFDISNENDTLWIHFSGHGTQINDTDGDETGDNKDEVIITVNPKRLDVNRNFAIEGIKDDTLNKIFHKNKSKTFIVFDCCNSGTMGDLKWSFDYVLNESYNGSDSSSGNNISFEVRELNEKKYKIEKRKENEKSNTNNITILSGARDDQYAFDAYNYNAKLPMGALTVSFLYQLRLNRHNVNITKLHEDICNYLIINGYGKQTPCLSSFEETPNLIISKHDEKVLLNKNITRKSDQKGSKNFYNFLNITDN